MRNISITGLLSIVIFAAVVQGQTGSNSLTYVVGTCRPNMTSFATIAAALAASPSPVIVDVCPGTYNEQLTITQPVTLQGVTSGNLGEVVVAVPLAGLVQNATSLDGIPLAAQLFVNNVAGAVNITNMTFDAGNDLSDTVAGVYYQNSSGTVNHVTTRNQGGPFENGLGIWIEGGASGPSVLVENSTIHDFRIYGILADADGDGNTLTATIKSNSVNGGGNVAAGVVGISTGASTAATVSSNFVIGCSYGVLVPYGPAGAGAAGTVSSNTIGNSSTTGIFMGADGVSATSNKVFGSSVEGILVSTSSGSVQNNSISEAPIGIELSCLSNSNVHSNTIADATTGVDSVPGSLTMSNTYYSVATIRNSATCPGAH